MPTKSSEFNFSLPGTPVTALLMLITWRSLRKVAPALPELKYRHCLGVVATGELIANPQPIFQMGGKAVQSFRGSFR